MPSAGTSSSKADTTTSAWSRLVQLTRTASNTPQSNAAVSTWRSESTPMSKGSSSPPAPPPRIRRRNQPASRPVAATSSPPSSTQNQDDNVMSAQCHPPADLPRCAEAECIDVCPCQEGDTPLPGGKCSFSGTDKEVSASCSPRPTPPQKIDLHTFWAPITKEKTTPTAESGGSVITNVKRPRTKDQGRHASADSADRHTDDQPVPSPPVQLELKKLHLERLDTHQSVTLACAPITSMDLSPRLDLGTAGQHATTRKPSLRSATARLGARKITRYEQEVTAPAHEKLFAGLVATEDRRNSAKALPMDRTGNGEVEAQERRTTSASSEMLHNMASSLQEDNQDTLNRGLQPAQQPLNYTTSNDDDTTPLTTPGSSQDSPSSSNSASETNESQTPVPAARRTKRRLTLHGDALDSQRAQQHKKRRKEAPSGKRQTVQTTLSLAIGGSAGMRECKVCDTVWNPFHPEDVKVHAKRHAGALRNRVDVA